jgi:hypothetical protein
MNSGQTVKLHEEEIEDSSYLNPTDSTQTISFLPNDNHPIIFPSPMKTFFKTLSFTFRAYSNISTLIQLEDISFNIDIDGYLTLGIRNRQTQRIETSKPINDGNSYSVQMELNKKMINVWIDESKKTSIELFSSFLMIDNFIFGLRNQFIGCIENITYNHQIFSFENLSFHRRQCPIKSLNDIFVNQIISFGENDQPLIIQLTTPEEFRSFSFRFSTQESNCILGSLADQTYEHILVLSIRNERLLLRYIYQHHQPIEISMIAPITNRQQHQIIIRDILSIELDGNMIIKNLTDRFSIQKISIGKLDEFIEEHFPDLNSESFLGCMNDIMFNKNPLIKLEHIDQSNRLTNICQLPKREREFNNKNTYR